MKRGQYIFSVLLIVVHVFTLIPAGLARNLPLIGLLPPGFDKDLDQCWSSLQKTEGCVGEVYTVFNNNTQIGLLSPNCCKTITEIESKCFGKMFYNPFFIPFLRAFCIQRDEPSVPSLPKTAIENNKGIDESKIEPQLFAPWLEPDYTKCLSSLQSVGGCIEEVFGSLTSFQIRLPGQACCKAVTEISENCWSKLLPLNPFVNPLLKGYCTNVVHIAPGPTKQIKLFSFDGVSRAEEDEEEIDPAIGRVCVGEPCRLGSIDSSRILKRVKDEFGVDDGFVCLGGFKNVRNVYDWKGLKLELDETSYDFGTCYEIECESEDPEGVKKLLEAFLKENGISYLYSEASKFAIFRSGMLPEYTIKEDEHLCRAYVLVMYRGVKGNGKRKDKTKDMYWERIHEVYHALCDNCKDRKFEELFNRFQIIKDHVSNYVGHLLSIYRKRPSSWTESDIVRSAQQDYEAREKKEWAFEHCFQILRVMHMYNPEIILNPNLLKRPPGIKAQRRARRSGASVLLNSCGVKISDYLESYKESHTKR